MTACFSGTLVVILRIGALAKLNDSALDILQVKLEIGLNGNTEEIVTLITGADIVRFITFEDTLLIHITKPQTITNLRASHNFATSVQERMVLLINRNFG